MTLKTIINKLLPPFFTNKKTLRSPEVSSEIVRISHKINPHNSDEKVIMAGGKYFRVKER